MAFFVFFDLDDLGFDHFVKCIVAFAVRVSPTPANMETPPCNFAMLLDVFHDEPTVLPTPAPPNAPTFPPFKNGQIKSMTLMPVVKTCGLVD